jgi:hypothetical protein
VLPTRAGALAERGGRLALDDDLHVVHRQVRLAIRIPAPRFGWVVRGDVPAANGQIDAAAVCDSVVDDDELLVVRGADGQVAVEHDLDALGLLSAEDPARKELPIDGVEHRVIPEQDADFELPAAFQEPLDQRTELDGCTVGRRRGAFDARAAMQLPAEDEHRALCGEQRRAQCGEVARGVDQHGRALGGCQPPARVAFDQNALRGGIRLPLGNAKHRPP